MKKIYLDNAATSFPKAPKVGEAMADFLTNYGCSVNRSTSNASYEIEEIIFETRELICKLFNFNNPENVVFTKNITESLNVLLKGFLNPNDHVIISSLEHNAVGRPLNSLKNNGVEVSIIPCDENGIIDIENIQSHIKHNTKAIIMTHASNVSGTILPIKEIGKIAKENNLFFILDSAQTAGVLEIHMDEICAHAIAFTGHKGLLGPQGIGGFIIKDELASKVRPLIEGGTGSFSEQETQPAYMPDKFESGTPNIPGILGLNKSLHYLMEKGIHNIRNKELELTELFLEKVSSIDNIKIIGANDLNCQTSVVSIDFSPLGLDNAVISHILSKEYGISTRCGLHCAPLAHKSFNTFPQGTVRFSFGHFNTEEEVEYAAESIKKIIHSEK